MVRRCVDLEDGDGDDSSFVDEDIDGILGRSSSIILLYEDFTSMNAFLVLMGLKSLILRSSHVMCVVYRSMIWPLAVIQCV